MCGYPFNKADPCGCLAGRCSGDKSIFDDNMIVLGGYPEHTIYEIWQKLDIILQNSGFSEEILQILWAARLKIARVFAKTG